MKKIRLRAMEPEDLELLYRIENDKRLWDLGITNVPYSRYTLHDFIANASGDIYTDKQVRLMIETDDGEVVGIADLVNFDAKNCRSEIGIVIECQHRRKGYALQALEQMADYAKRVLHLHQLYAIVATENHASSQLFSKAGYTLKAQLPDWLFDGQNYHGAILMQKILN